MDPRASFVYYKRVISFYTCTLDICGLRNARRRFFSSLASQLLQSVFLPSLMNVPRILFLLLFGTYFSNRCPCVCVAAKEKTVCFSRRDCWINAHMCDVFFRVHSAVYSTYADERMPQICFTRKFLVGWSLNREINGETQQQNN